MRPLMIGVAIVTGLAALANGLFMLVSPGDWYLAVPGVTTTGPFNQHFVRDIGLVFVFVGTSFLAGAAKPGFRLLLWVLPTLWLSGHALFHFWEVAVGVSEHAALGRDFAAVTLPAIIGIVLTIWAANAPGRDNEFGPTR